MKYSSLLFLTLVLLSSIAHAAPANEKPRSFYLDATSGKDTKDGRSEKTAWKSFARLQNLPLQPGDRILLRRGGQFKGILTCSGNGSSAAPILIDAYGTGKKPSIVAPDSSLYAVLIENSNYITVQNLDIQNTGSARLPRRTGIKVLCKEFGVSHRIILNNLDIHDVNGSLVKKAGGGSAILIENNWETTISRFDSLLIENCTVRRCERNAIIWSAPWNRKKWYPSTHTVVRKNLIEEVPGDGIVPIGCDSALVEYNLMRKCSNLMKNDEAAAGIWPWSCDNTLIQFNEVSDHKAAWDGQGFDSDFNCQNTTIQYNYSHDNDGGFLLICNAGKADTTESIGNIGSVVQYNLSRNDGIRPGQTYVHTYFSPVIHIGGPCKDTRVNNNILELDRKPNDSTDRTMIALKSWDGYADRTTFTSNIFFAPQPSSFITTRSTNNTFSGNYYLGTFQNKPVDGGAKSETAVYKAMVKEDASGLKGLNGILKKVEVANGAASMEAVDKVAIEAYFISLQKN